MGWFIVLDGVRGPLAGGLEFLWAWSAVVPSGTSGRQPSSVEVVIEGTTDERAAELLAAFASTFPPIMQA
jgi:hypothetical protein